MRRPCFHPLSCRACQSFGGPCRAHAAGEPGHEGCTGRGTCKGYAHPHLTSKTLDADGLCEECAEAWDFEISRKES